MRERKTEKGKKNENVNEKGKEKEKGKGKRKGKENVKGNAFSNGGKRRENESANVQLKLSVNELH